MRLKVAALVGFCLAVGVVAGQGDAKGDAKRIEGTWQIVSAQKGGKDAPEDEIKNVRLTFRAGKMTFKNGDEEREGTYKLDPSKKPKHLDLTVQEKEVIHSIYEFKNDTLRICASAPGDDRPTEFKSEEGSRVMVLTLRRAKKDDKEDK